MSFPNIIYGDYGDEKATSSTKIGSLPLGTRMVLPDGAEYVQGRASATAMVAGNLYQGNAGIQATDADYKCSIAVASGGAAGSTTVVLTAGATTGVTVDQFQDGTLITASSVGTGVGHVYRIKSNASAAAGSSITINLYPTDPFKVALAAGSTTCGLREHEYFNLTLTTGDTVGVGTLAGVAPVAVAASYYCWVQRKGRAAVKGDGTLIVGVPVVPSDNADGAVESWPTSAADTAGVRAGLSANIIGICENVAASVQFSLINLKIG